ncbi:MAG TPA: hypothetical protein VD866_32770, partial [Urbifossiella sp.]|nr:hypothetical protein [Urbifossiella sp.]
IVEFASGKDEDYQRGKAKVTAALSAEQREILEKRGVLSPAEIHRLASKTKKAVGADHDKAACHSDNADDAEAQSIQARRVPLAQVGE